VSAAAYSVRRGKLTEAADCFAQPYWDNIRARIAGKAEEIRKQGFFGPAMLGMGELEYTQMAPTLKNLEKSLISKSERFYARFLKNKMKTNARILIGILVVSALSSILFLLLFQESGAAEISLNRTEYNSGGTLEVAVRNDFGREICFSSCYPYLAEIRDESGKWKEYVYQDCPEAAVAADCVPPRDLKNFAWCWKICRRALIV
jgi:Archaeal fructose 1,6-bisphosphatase